MGNCNGKKDSVKDKLILNYSNQIKIIHTEEGHILKSPLNIKKYDEVTLLFCENDLIIKTYNLKYIVIYNKIISWYANNVIWGFNMNYKDKIEKFTFKVEDGLKVSEKIKNITTNIAEDINNLYTI